MGWVRFAFVFASSLITAGQEKRDERPAEFGEAVVRYDKTVFGN